MLIFTRFNERLLKGEYNQFTRRGKEWKILEIKFPSMKKVFKIIDILLLEGK